VDIPASRDDVQQAIANRAQSAAVTVATGTQRPVLTVADRTEPDGDTRPVEDSVPESAVRCQTALNDQAPAPNALCNRSHPTQAAKRVAVAPPHRVSALSEQHGQHPRADAGQRQQDQRVRRAAGRRDEG